LHFLENDKLHQIVFQGLGENTCLLQPALKSTAPGLERSIVENKPASSLVVSLGKALSGLSLSFSS